MRAAMYHGREDIRIEEVEQASVGPEQVRVAVDSGGLCGSDLYEYAVGPIFVPDDEPHLVSKG